MHFYGGSNKLLYSHKQKKKIHNFVNGRVLMIGSKKKLKNCARTAKKNIHSVLLFYFFSGSEGGAAMLLVRALSAFPSGTAVHSLGTSVLSRRLFF